MSLPLPPAPRMAGGALFPSARRHGTTAKAVILAMAGLVTLSVCGTIGMSAYEDYRRTLTVAETRTRDAVRVLEEHARRTFETSDRVLRRVIDHLHADGLDAFTSSGHHPELKTLAATLPETGSLWIQDDAGRLISSSRIENPYGLVFSDREYWQVHAQGADTHIGPLIISRISQSMYFTYSRAMRDDQGKLLAVVVAAIIPSYVSEYFSWAGDGNELAFGLYKDNGDIVLRFPVRKEDVGRNVLTSKVFTEFYPKVTAANYRATSTIDGADRIAAFVKVAGQPLLAGASLKTADVFADWHRRLERNIAMGAVVLLGIGALCGYGLRLARREQESWRKAVEASARAQLALDGARAAVWEWDIASGRVEWSPGYHEVFGLPEGTAPSYQAWRSAILAEDVEAADAALMTAIAEGRPQAVAEYRIAHSRLGIRWLYCPVQITYDKAGRPLRTAGVNIDITRLKEIEAALQAARDEALRAKSEAERADSAKSKFLAAASHDLRQPVQSLVLLLATLKPHVSEGPAARALVLMERSFDALNGLLTSLLDISRLDAGILAPEPRILVIGEVLERLAGEYRLRARQKGLELRVVPSCAVIRTDGQMLDRILRNLLENALHYTGKGRILLGCRRRGGDVALVVADTGMGIPTDKQDAVFEEFYQVGNPERDRGQGLGLGLSIVQRLARLLGARVELRSHEGRGSAFAVVFPRHRPEEEKA